MAFEGDGKPPASGGHKHSAEPTSDHRTKKAAAEVFDAFFGTPAPVAEPAQVAAEPSPAAVTPAVAAPPVVEPPTFEPPAAETAVVEVPVVEPVAAPPVSQPVTQSGMSVVLGSSSRPSGARQRQRAADELARTLAEFEAEQVNTHHPVAAEPLAPVAPPASAHVAPSEPVPAPASVPVEAAEPVATLVVEHETVTVPVIDAASPLPEAEPAPSAAEDEDEDANQVEVEEEAPPAPEPKPRKRRRREPGQATPAATAAAAPAPEPVVPASHQHIPIPDTSAPPVPRRVEFEPRRGLSRLLGLLVLLSLAAAATTSWLAYQSQQSRDIVFAGIMVALALVLASIRATISPVQLLIEAGQLYVRQGHLNEVHDLTSPYTKVEVTGDPSTSKWEVVISRHDAPTRRIGHEVVSGKEFVPVVRYWRAD